MPMHANIVSIAVNTELPWNVYTNITWIDFTYPQLTNFTFAQWVYITSAVDFVSYTFTTEIFSVWLLQCVIVPPNAFNVMLQAISPMVLTFIIPFVLAITFKTHKGLWFCIGLIGSGTILWLSGIITMGSAIFGYISAILGILVIRKTEAMQNDF